MRSTNLWVFVLVLGMSATSSAIAGEVGGHNLVVTKPSATTELPDGSVYRTTGNSQVCLTTDGTHPLNDASGDCDGACVVTADGDATCMGSCTWVDTDGDLVFFTWDGDQQSGTWKLLGGSGKWANASGVGDWEATAVFAGGMSRNSWSGSIEMN